MKKIYLLLFASLSLFAYSTEELTQARAMLSGVSTEQMAKDMRDSMKDSLPLNIDAISTLNSVEAKGKKLIFKGTVNVPEHNKPDVENQKKKQAAGLCSNPFIFSALEKGLVMEYKYSYFKSKKELANITISKKDCL